MDVLLRDARSGDLSDMLALYRHLSPGDPDLSAEDAAPSLAALIASDISALLVAEVDGLVVSSCLLLIVPNMTRGGRAFAIVENVVTHADYRRRGLASALLNLAQQRAMSADCYKMMLATGRQNDAVLRFYERAGFTRGGKTFFEMRWV